MKKEEVKSILEETTKKLVLDVIKDVSEEMLNSESELETYILGLELINLIYKVLLENDFRELVEIEYTYRNGNIYDLHEYLNK